MGVGCIDPLHRPARDINVKIPREGGHTDGVPVRVQGYEDIDIRSKSAGIRTLVRPKQENVKLIIGLEKLRTDWGWELNRRPFCRVWEEWTGLREDDRIPDFRCCR
jgi:hypothetical protein